MVAEAGTGSQHVVHSSEQGDKAAGCEEPVSEKIGQSNGDAGRDAEAQAGDGKLSPDQLILLSPELLSQCPAHGPPPLAHRLVEGKEAHLFLFVPPGENPIDVASPAHFLGLAVGEAHESPALFDGHSDLRYQYN